MADVSNTTIITLPRFTPEQTEQIRALNEAITPDPEAMFDVIGGPPSTRQIFRMAKADTKRAKRDIEDAQARLADAQARMDQAARLALFRFNECAEDLQEVDVGRPLIDHLLDIGWLTPAGRGWIISEAGALILQQAETPDAQP